MGALELIEAHWLFGIPAEETEAVVHPQSIAHAMVEFQDSSVVTQLACPDMRGPIQQALSFPHRVASLVKRLDPGALARCSSSPGPSRFPLLGLAGRVIESGVRRSDFQRRERRGRLRFSAFGDHLWPDRRVGDRCHGRDRFAKLSSLDDALEADRSARACPRGTPAAFNSLGLAKAVLQRFRAWRRADRRAPGCRRGPSP